MRTTTVIAAILLPIFSCLAAPVSEITSTSGNVLRLPFKRHVVRNSQRLSDRSLPVSLSNDLVIYLVDLSIGSPPQNVQLVLDTGSSETWAFSSNACSNCGGTYNPSLSRTASAVNNIGPFNQAYADGTSAQGYYVTDKAVLGTAEVTDLYLGVATTAVKQGNPHGVMGISFDIGESSSKQHPGIMDTLLNQKIISSNSYSIFLDDIDASTGSIIFGGTDSSKYTGKLVNLPIIPKPTTNSIPGLNVAWTSLTITNGTGASAKLTSSDLSYPVLLDTGSTLTTVPATIFWQLYAYFGATGLDNGVSYVNCNMPKGYLTFGFGVGPAVTIKVPFSELAIEVSPNKCWFGLQPQDGSELTFGDTFLRSAYVNVDFGVNAIGLAQSAWI